MLKIETLHIFCQLLITMFISNCATCNLMGFLYENYPRIQCVLALQLEVWIMLRTSSARIVIAVVCQRNRKIARGIMKLPPLELASSAIHGKRTVLPSVVLFRT